MRACLCILQETIDFRCLEMLDHVLVISTEGPNRRKNEARKRVRKEFELSEHYETLYRKICYRWAEPFTKFLTKQEIDLDGGLASPMLPTEHTRITRRTVPKIGSSLCRSKKKQTINHRVSAVALSTLPNF